MWVEEFKNIHSFIHSSPVTWLFFQDVFVKTWLVIQGRLTAPNSFLVPGQKGLAVVSANTIRAKSWWNYLFIRNLLGS